MLPELAEDETGFETIPDGDLELRDELEARRAMIRLEQLGRDQKRVKATKAAVAEEYDRQLERLARDEERIRASIRAYVLRNGKISFPDVGTAYTRRVDAKIEIVDPEAFEDELGAMFRKDKFDETAAKAYALQQALDSGVIVPGTELVPAGEDVSVRKA